MTMIFLLILFAAQLIGFYFLALLYAKVSKFDDLEKRQNKLMQEMDDSITAYLSELKDENNRLIEQLAEREQQSVSHSKQSTIVKPLIPEVDDTPAPVIKMPTMPVNLALKSYNATPKRTVEPKPVQVVLDDKAQAIQLHDAGHSIEEIAKTLGKGKTEVELILKFR